MMTICLGCDRSLPRPISVKKVKSYAGHVRLSGYKAWNAHLVMVDAKLKGRFKKKVGGPCTGRPFSDVADNAPVIP